MINRGWFGFVQLGIIAFLIYLFVMSYIIFFEKLSIKPLKWITIYLAIYFFVFVITAGLNGYLFGIKEFVKGNLQDRIIVIIAFIWALSLTMHQCRYDKQWHPDKKEKTQIGSQVTTTENKDVKVSE